MKFLLDTSPGMMLEKASDRILGQLLTPLTGYADAGLPYAIDNGCFKRFPEQRFLALLQRQLPNKDRCLFVSCPDVVGNGRRTLELFRHRDKWLSGGWPVALVAQDGIEALDIPWEELSALFIGGRDPWKESQAVADLIFTAKALGLWVHAGRVNSPHRFKHFKRLGVDSCDGSGVSIYTDAMLSKIIEDEAAPVLFEDEP